MDKRRALRRSLSLFFILLIIVAIAWSRRPSADEYGYFFDCTGSNVPFIATLDTGFVTDFDGTTRYGTLTAYNEVGETLTSATVTMNSVRGMKVGEKDIFSKITIRGNDDYFGKMAVGQEYKKDDNTLGFTLFNDSETGWVYSIVGSNYNNSKSFIEPDSLVKGGHKKEAFVITGGNANDYSFEYCNYDRDESTSLGVNLTGVPVLVSDSFISGRVNIVDALAHSPAETSGEGSLHGAINTPVNLTSHPDAAIYNFTVGDNGSYWWLADIVRPNGIYEVEVGPTGEYTKDWASKTLYRQEVINNPYEGTSYFRGIHPMAVAALEQSGVDMNRVSQGLGNAEASAGTHGPEPDSQYTASVDIAVIAWNDLPELSDSEINQYLDALRSVGFAAFYRPTIGDFPHIHAVYAGYCPLKDSTDSQVQSFIAGHNGLSGDPAETIKPPTQAQREGVANIYMSCLAYGRYKYTELSTGGQLNTLLSLVTMDGIYSGYFGHWYPDSYHGSLPISGWDTTSSKNVWIGNDAFLQDGNYHVVLPYGDASPDPFGEPGYQDPPQVARFEVRLNEQPWQDTGLAGYNNGSSGSLITTFDFDFMHQPDAIEFDINTNGWSDKDRRNAYKWGLSITKQGMVEGEDQNPVIYLTHAAHNIINLASDDYSESGLETGTDSNTVSNTDEPMLESEPDAPVQTEDNTEDNVESDNYASPEMSGQDNNWFEPVDIERAQAANYDFVEISEPPVSAPPYEDPWYDDLFNWDPEPVFYEDSYTDSSYNDVYVYDPETEYFDDWYDYLNPVEYMDYAYDSMQNTITDMVDYFYDQPETSMVDQPEQMMADINFPSELPPNDAVYTDYSWYEEPAVGTNLPIVEYLPDYAPDPAMEMPTEQSFFTDMFNWDYYSPAPEEIIYNDPYYNESFMYEYTPEAEPLFNDWYDYVNPVEYMDYAYSWFEDSINSFVDYSYGWFEPGY